MYQAEYYQFMRMMEVKSRAKRRDLIEEKGSVCEHCGVPLPEDTVFGLETLCSTCGQIAD
ncbi:MAG: hypothetical protein JWO80_864 [Bryobacterales bacterium]|nr:hypothetical protein [Bryobacterales bacterium]